MRHTWLHEPWRACTNRSLWEIEQQLLLPDMDPRLAALLPALQRSGSSSAASGVAHAALASRGVTSHALSPDAGAREDVVI
jgi:hypothetical protein